MRDAEEVSSSGEVDGSSEVGTGAASEVPNSVSTGVVGTTVELGTAPTKLARVVASAGVENVRVLLSSWKALEASWLSVAVVVKIVVT